MNRGERLGVAMIGYSFMGAAHSQAWRSVNHFFDVGRTIEMTVVCGRDQQGVAAAAQRLGWASHETDWRAVLARDDVALVDVCTPGST
ncbi:MAG: Gfo/Idh/MocA family oxidoreductase, partial [Mycobacteriaceae bacterium]